MNFLSRNICAICQCRLTVHQEARGGVCDRLACRSRKAAEIDARRRQVKAADAEAARQLAVEYYDKMKPRLGVADPASLRLVIIPDYDQPVVKLPRKRRAQFRARLADVIQETSEEKMSPEVMIALAEDLRIRAQERPSDPAVAASCAVCTGCCCREGGTSAYLDRAAIRSYMARHPGMRFREVLKAYLSKLPSATFKGSCVYHGPTGCALPREMRASICGTYYCDGMKTLRKEIASEGPKTTLLVSTEKGKLFKAAVIEPDGKTMRLEEMTKSE
jgi:hypothetical protein